MRILMTGMTPRGVGSLRVKGDYAYLQLMMRDALTELGRTVDLRVVEWGEDLTVYDMAFVHFGILSSQSSYHTPSMAWTLEQMPNRSVLYCDDWGVERTRGDWNRILNETYTDGMYKGMEKWEKHILWRGEKWSHYTKAQTELMRLNLRRVLEPKCPWSVAAPMFPWGDHEKLIRGVINAKLLPFDISPMVAIPVFYKNIDLAARKKQWVLATLSDQTDWVKKIGVRWPVEYLGKNGEDVSESVVVQRYANSWGVLCPEYKSAGSGWWRDRFHFAALTGSILLGSRQECECIGEGYYRSRMTIENMSTEELAALARHQSDLVLGQLWSKSKLLEWFKWVTELAAGGVL